MSREEALREAYAVVKQNIEAAKARGGRTDTVTVLAVTKTYPAEDIRILRELGIEDFAENKVQELGAKAAELPDDTRFHMIGSLQTNKVRQLLPITPRIQSLDRASLCKELQKRATEPVQALVEVNIADDANKAGLPPEDVADFLKGMHAYPMIRIEGIMVMGSHTKDRDRIRADFKRAKDLFDSLKVFENDQIHMQVLSMGMSHDYEIAVEEGATHVRIGSALLGERG